MKSKHIIFNTWLLMIVVISNACSGQPALIRFDQRALQFPITVEEAVSKYDLLYKPPGYYYSEKDGIKMSLDILTQQGDYDNEYQPKETLYPRNVKLYNFEYDPVKYPFSVIKSKVEDFCKCKLTFTEDSVQAYQPSFDRAITDRMPRKGKHTYSIVRINEQVSLGIREKPMFRNEAFVPQVIFFYNQTDLFIRQRLCSY